MEVEELQKLSATLKEENNTLKKEGEASIMFKTKLEKTEEQLKSLNQDIKAEEQIYEQQKIEIKSKQLKVSNLEAKVDKLV